MTNFPFPKEKWREESVPHLRAHLMTDTMPRIAAVCGRAHRQQMIVLPTNPGHLYFKFFKTNPIRLNLIQNTHTDKICLSSNGTYNTCARWQNDARQTGHRPNLCDYFGGVFRAEQFVSRRFVGGVAFFRPRYQFIQQRAYLIICGICSFGIRPNGFYIRIK